MNKLGKLLKSRTFWSVVVLFAVSGVEGVRDVVPANLLPYVQAILGMATLYFKANPSQDY